jgi:hypothetical protein
LSRLESSKGVGIYKNHIFHLFAKKGLQISHSEIKKLVKLENKNLIAGLDVL